MGHSMGGHGALTIGLKNAAAYRSISAFSPVVNPVAVPWGQAALAGYLGDDQETWKQYDTCELLKQYDGPKLPVLVDQVRAVQHRLAGAGLRCSGVTIFPGLIREISARRNH